MKKITLLITLFIVSLGQGQTFSTGIVTFDGTFNGKIDVNGTTNLVTLTLNAPNGNYFAVGFGQTNMASGGDCVIFTGTEGTGVTILSDRTFNGNGTPLVDSGVSADISWTVTTNSVAGSTRTIVATRPRVSAGDFTFPTTAGSLSLAWSRSTAGYALNYHGGTRGGVTANYTLSNDSFNIEDFKMYPNPAKGFTTLELPINLESGVVKIYDALGRVVKNQTITTTDKEINTSDLTTGSYLLVLRTDYGNATKTLLVE